LDAPFVEIGDERVQGTLQLALQYRYATSAEINRCVIGIFVYPRFTRSYLLKKNI